jgi:hypothetical protein
VDYPLVNEHSYGHNPFQKKENQLNFGHFPSEKVDGRNPAPVGCLSHDF